MLADLLESITQFLEQLVLTSGAAGIVLIALLENLLPPTPSEFLYPLAGKLAYDGAISLLAVIVAGITGSLIGSLFYYFLGYRLGQERVRVLIAHYGTLRILGFNLRLTSVEEYDQALALFERRGNVIVFVARIMPVVHSVVSIPAGVVRMNLVLFVFYTILGAAAWIIPLTLLGYWLGENWQQVLDWLDTYQTVWYGMMAVALAAYIFYRRKKVT